MGISFSALELPIRAPGGAETLKALSDIDKQAAKLGKEIDVSVGALGRLGKQLDVTDRQAVQAFRQSAAAEREWLNITKANADQHAKLGKIVQDVDQRVQRAAPNWNRSAQATVQIAGGLETMARTGNAAGEGLRQIISQGSNIAFMFGTAGPIVGAVGITAVAIWQLLDRTDRKVKELINNSREELESLARSANVVGVGQKAQFAFSGDPDALRKEGESEADWIARRGGLQGVRARAADLRARLEAQQAGQATWIEERLGTMSTSPTLLRAKKADNAALYVELLAHEQRLQREYDETRVVLDRLTAAEGSRAQNRQRIESDERARRESEKSGKRSLRTLDSIYQHGPGQDEIVRGFLNSLAPTFEERTDAAMAKSAGPLPNAVNLDKMLQDAAKAASRAVDVAIREFEEPLAKVEQTIADGVAGAIIGGLAAGIAAAIQDGNIGAGFLALGGVMLAAIGGMFIDLGTTIIAGSALMEAATLAIASMVPGAGIAAGLALIALGAGLQGAGGALGRGGRGGGGAGRGYGGGGYGPAQIIDRGYINPVGAPRHGSADITPRTPISLHLGLMNPADPATQSLVKTTYDRAAGRGSL